MGADGGCALSRESLILGWLEVRCLSLAESDNETYPISIKYPLITLPRSLELTQYPYSQNCILRNKN